MAEKKCSSGCAFKTSVGGQALMEGIMMKGPEKVCVAVRKPDGGIDIQTEPVKKRFWAKIPLLRGACNMVDSMVSGYKYLTRSAELSMDEEVVEEPSKLDRWIEEKLGDKALTVVTAIAGVLGVALSVVLFIVVPTGIVSLLELLFPLGGWKTLVESIIKACIFVGYLALVSRMKEIRRVFSYHGAEHKTIACYEAGEELTVENVRKHKRFHPRCGTSFLIIVLIISFIVGSLLPWGSPVVRVLLKLLTLPVVMGVAYELIKLAGRYDNILTRIISAPGLWMQRLTTNEPDDSMIEVAIAAVLPVLPEDPEQGKW